MVGKIGNHNLLFYLFRKDNVKLQNQTMLKKNLFDNLQLSNDNRYSFYQQNKNNPRALLDAINFFHGAVGAEGGPDGDFHFGSDGIGQRIPKSAVPRINADALPPLYAVNNKLCLTTNSYYAFKGNDGKNYACAFNGKVIHKAFSEAILGNDMDNVPVKCRSNTVAVMWHVTDLVNGTTSGGITERSVVKQRLAQVGIKPGKVIVSVDGEEKVYYLGESGRIFREDSALDTVEMYNRNTWLKNRSVGDKIMVFGKEYTIQEDGHINVPTENFWYGEECNFGNVKRKLDMKKLLENVKVLL